MKALKDFSIVGKAFREGEEINEADLKNADIAALADNGFIEPTIKKVKDKD